MTENKYQSYKFYVVTINYPWADKIFYVAAQNIIEAAKLVEQHVERDAKNRRPTGARKTVDIKELDGKILIQS